jgi:signal transduction histidine kinase
MISVVDQTYQYIIAEGTKTLSLQDGTVTDQDDQLWFGLRTIPRSVGICARALGQFTEVEAHDGSISDTIFQPLQFVIPDLSKDPRFENQPFVCGAPYLRFYAGVPIRSPAGHIIGIYSIVDDKPREDFGELDLDILKDLAATVMDHLALGTVRGRHHRADRMIKGLGLFVEGKATLRDWWLRSGHLAQGPTASDGSRGGWTLKARADAEFGPQMPAISNDLTLEQHNEFPLKSSESETPETKPTLSGVVNATLHSVPSETLSSDSAIPVQSSDQIGQRADTELLGLINPLLLGHVSQNAIGPQPVQKSTSPDSAEREEGDSSKEPEAETMTTSQDMAAMFKRASNLIRESITVEGCVFLDASSATIENITAGPDTEERESTSGSTPLQRSPTSEDEKPMWNTAYGEVQRDLKPTISYTNAFSQASLCEVLGYSLKFDLHPGDGQATPNFQFPKDTLHRLLKLYPNGSILNFEQNGSISSSEEEPNTTLSNDSTSNEGYSRSRIHEKKRHFKEVDSKIIMETFPGIRRLAFFPLWDTSTKTWFCGALAWTNDPLRILDADDDMAYLAAFGNSIMAEKARLDASMADRMKSNFISTVSHELRSPLHGILASAELLKDMSVGAAQIDVINMINICGRTLLDTINHVLDFTELNRSRKSKLSEKKKRSGRDALKTQSHTTSHLLKNNANLDLSILVEDVVNSTLVGHDFGQSTLLALRDGHAQLPSFEMQSRGNAVPELHDVPLRVNGGVKVIVDIDWRLDWVFSLQPGAWSRIVMNLFGNALKYTKHGYVCVSLKSVANVSKQDNRTQAILTVSDTGKGISKEFLKHHIFMPFWQEDSLVTGTGLGLSIVQQIVRDLGGHIEIKSKEGAGTKVTVQIPLGMRPLTCALDNSMNPAAFQKMKGLKVHVISAKTSTESEKESVAEISEADAASVFSMRKSLCKTLKYWFEMNVVDAPSIHAAEADVYLLLTDELSTTGEQNGTNSFLRNPEVIQLAEANALIVLCTAPASRKASELQEAGLLIQQP